MAYRGRSFYTPLALDELTASGQTLLYMLIQRAGAGMLPPPGVTPPPWEMLAQQWDEAPKPASGDEAVVIGPAEIVLGHDDSEAEDDAFPPERVPEHRFGWDNESPRRVVKVGAVRVSRRCITNEEYLDFWKGEGEGKVAMPQSWVLDDGVVKVCLVVLPAREWALEVTLLRYRSVQCTVPLG
jgi:formylglycine-generating enzyme required for sulfatase activity